MRIFLNIAIFVCLSVTGVLAHTSLIKGEHNNKQTFKVEKVNGNVHVLFGSGGNIGISYGEDGLMTIDTQFEKFALQIKTELAKLGSDSPKYVFNTHFHGDHTGGNSVFGVAGIIIAHQNVRNRLLSKVDRQGKPQEPAPKAALPSITFNKGLSLYFNGEQVKAVHFPRGHTDGDAAIFFTESKVVHLGDDFFVGRFPFVDLASGGSVQGLVTNIGKMLQIIPPDWKIIPGHGPIATIDDLKDYHQMLIETTLNIRKQMKEGKSLEDIKKAGLPDKFKDAGSGFINQGAWIETIYKSYEMKMKKDK